MRTPVWLRDRGADQEALMGGLHLRAGRFALAPGLRLACALAVLLAPATFATTSAYFTGSTANGGDQVSAAEAQPPSGLAVAQACAAGPVISFRAASSATGVDTLTLPTPSGAQAGDVLVAQVANRYGTYTLTAPSGWNLIRRDAEASMITSALLWRVAGAGEPATATFSLSGSSGVQMVGGIAAYTGVHSSTPVNISDAISDDSPTAVTPSVTTTVANTVLLRAVTKRQETHPAPVGTTERWKRLSGTGTATLGATAGDEPFAGPGATAERTSTSTSNFSAEWIGQTVALRPASGPPSASLSWTASPSSWATGYGLERVVGGTVQATRTVTPITATSTTDGPLVGGTAYTYRLWGYSGTWTSSAVTVSFTPSC